MTGFSACAEAITPAVVRSATAQRPRRRVASGIPSRSSGGRVAIIALMACALVAAIVGPGLGSGDVPVERFDTVTVTESGSLWEIAAAHRAPGMDIADTVEVIRTANRLDSSVIHVGQVLRVPVPASGQDAFASR